MKRKSAAFGAQLTGIRMNISLTYVQGQVDP
jgi:hypothetical protein